MVFSKTCPICKRYFSSLVEYMGHIKENHSKIHPEDFVENKEEITWSFRSKE